MRYSVQPRDRIFLKDCEFLYFAKNMGKNISKNISKNLSSKYVLDMLTMRQKLLDDAKQPATGRIKTSPKRVIQKSLEATGDLIGNKTADQIRKVSKHSQQHNSEKARSDHYIEIPTERYVSPEETEKNIDKLRLKQYNDEISKKNKSLTPLTTKQSRNSYQ